MKQIGEYHLYKLYELSEEEREIAGAAGSRYIRNSILVFRPDQIDFQIGYEWRVASSKKEAKALIDAQTPEVSLSARLQEADARSRELELTEVRKRQNDTEAERRRKDRQEEEYEKQIDKHK